MLGKRNFMVLTSLGALVFRQLSKRHITISGLSEPPSVYV